MKIYTKTGDDGTTSLYGGKRVSKNYVRVKAYGVVDELNSLLGVVLSGKIPPDIAKYLQAIQCDLFTIGSHLSGSNISIDILTKKVSGMEKAMDQMDLSLPPLKNFILPQGCLTSTYLFWARAVARRAERAIVNLQEFEKVDRKILIYINRLSDFLFILARYMNLKQEIKEIIWKR